MSLEEQLDIAMKQRAMLAAAIVGTMEAPFASEEILRIKNGMMMLVMRMCSEDMLNDEIEKRVLMSMKEHCTEQIEINSLLDSVA